MKTILALLMLVLLPTLSIAGELAIKQVGANAFSGTLVDKIALAYDDSSTYDLGTQSIEKYPWLWIMPPLLSPM